MNNRGFTLVEVLVAMFILVFVLLGFFNWAYTIMVNNTAVEKMNTANMIALDVADRLQRMSDNALIRPKIGNEKQVGYTSAGNLKYCVGNLPKGQINADVQGMTEYTNPMGDGSIYVYDRNTCSVANPSCFAGSSIVEAANAHIDHPNSITNPETINPVRFVNNTTYYVVWSIAYLPCTPSSGDKRKIFITIYWIDPEPEDTSHADVHAKISSHIYGLRNVSLVVDKVIGVEP